MTFSSILEVVNIYGNIFGKTQKKILLGNFPIYAKKININKRQSVSI